MRACLLSLVILLAGCDGDSDTDAGPGGADAGPGSVDAGPGGVDAGPGGADAGPGDTDAGASMSIPDPGMGMNDWGFSVLPGNPCCSTPETAYAVGVVTMDPGYVQGDIAMGVFFYVFRTGPAYTSFSWPSSAPTDFVHLHDGDGLVFGPEITPDVSTPTSGTWTVLPDHVYVLELGSSMGGFF